MCAAPWMSWIAKAGASTVSAIDVELERLCASETVHGSDFAPGVVAAVTVAE